MELNKKKKCMMCNEDHPVRNCPQFSELSITERRTKADLGKLYYNCLGPNHSRARCLSKQTCRKCRRNHHTLLHFEEFKETKSTEIQDNNQELSNNKETRAIHICQTNKPLFKSVLLATAIVQVQTSDGELIPLRALIDQGGEASAISEKATQLLRLKRKNHHIDISHLDESHSKSTGIVSILLKSSTSQYTITTEALVMKSLVSQLPSKLINHFNWLHIEHLQLADPEFNKPGPIDLILGAEIYAEIILPEIRKGPQGTPVAQETEFGWIIFGQAHNQYIGGSISMLTFTIEEIMEKFMEIENVNDEK